MCLSFVNGEDLFENDDVDTLTAECLISRQQLSIVFTIVTIQSDLTIISHTEGATDKVADRLVRFGLEYALAGEGAVSRGELPNQGVAPWVRRKLECFARPTRAAADRCTLRRDRGL